jgi:MFS family permease
VQVSATADRGRPAGRVTSAGLGLGGVLLLALGHFVASVDRAAPSIYAPSLKAAFHLTDTQLGALQGPAFVLVFAGGMLLAGSRLNRAPRALLLGACVLVWTAACLAFALAQSYAGLFAARMVLGLGQAAFTPTAVAVLLAGVPKDRLAQAVATFTAGSAMGRSAGFLIGGALLALVSGGLLAGAGLTPWRAAALLTALPNLALAWALWRTAERVRPEPQAPNGLREAFARLLSEPAALGLHFLAAAGAVLMAQAAGAWAPSILHRAFHLDPARAAMVAGLVSLAAAPAGHLAGGRLLDRRLRDGKGPAAILAGGAGVAMLGVLGLLSAPSPAVAAAALFAVTAGAGAAITASLSGLQPLCPPAVRTATTSLFFAFTTVVGIGLGPLLTGALSDLFEGPRGLARALAVVLLVAGAGVALVSLCGAGPWRGLARRVADAGPGAAA